MLSVQCIVDIKMLIPFSTGWKGGRDDIHYHQCIQVPLVSTSRLVLVPEPGILSGRMATKSKQCRKEELCSRLVDITLLQDSNIHFL